MEGTYYHECLDCYCNILYSVFREIDPKLRSAAPGVERLRLAELGVSQFLTKLGAGVEMA